jgi:hypothetical protein
MKDVSAPKVGEGRRGFPTASRCAIWKSRLRCCIPRIIEKILKDLFGKSLRRLSSIQGLPAAIVSGTLLHWLILVFHIPAFGVPTWHWIFTDKPAGPFWLIGLLVVAPSVVICLVLRTDDKHGRRILALILLGYGLQMGLALLEERGIDGMRARMVYTGHAEFAVVATEQESIWSVVSNYERLLERGELGAFANSKPPGQLVLYMVTQRMANLVNPQTRFQDKLDWFRTFASYVWPWASYLVLVPLFYFARALVGSEYAVRACVLYLLIPSLNLITLHTDQVFFPLLFATALCLIAVAHVRGRVLLALAGGASVYLAVFCSFGLAVVVPLAIVVCFALSRQDGGFALGRFAKTVGGMLVGLLTMAAVFCLAFGYDIGLRYRNAITFHADWQNWEPSAGTVVHSAVLNLVEYALLLGIPVSASAISGLGKSLRRMRRWDFGVVPSVSLALLAVLVFLAFFSRSVGEVARLWLFLVPCVCIIAVEEILANPNMKEVNGFTLVLILQGVTVYLTKLHQDFW